MLRAFKIIMPHANDHARCRRQRRCIPSLPESTSCLEDRTLLSAAGGKAHTAEVAKNPANTKAGKEVTNLFESILQTSPTGAQLTQFVNDLHRGMSVKTLRKDLTAEARAQRGPQAPASMNVVTINNNPSASATGSSGGGMFARVSTMPALSGSAGTTVSPVDVTQVISQVPGGMNISRGFTFTPTPTPTSTSTSGSTAGASTSPTSTPTPTPTSPTSTTPGMGSSSGMSTSPTPTPTSPTPTPTSPTSTMPGMGSSSGMSMSPTSTMPGWMM